MHSSGKLRLQIVHEIVVSIGILGRGCFELKDSVLARRLQRWVEGCLGYFIPVK